MSYKIVNVKQIHKKADLHQVQPRGRTAAGDLILVVTSGSSGNRYQITQKANGSAYRCTCQWARYRPYRDLRSACSHVQAAAEWIESNADRRTSAWATPEDADRQHRPQIDLGDGVVLTSRKV